MSRSRRSRLLPLLAVLSLLSSPLLAFGGGHARPERAPDVARTFWQFLSSLLPAVDNARGTMDPNGSAATASDSHGTMDPNG